MLQAGSILILTLLAMFAALGGTQYLIDFFYANTKNFWAKKL